MNLVYPCDLERGYGPDNPTDGCAKANQKLTGRELIIYNLVIAECWTPGAEVIKLFSYSTQLSTKFIQLINVKMPTNVSILTFISMINTTS